MREEETLMEREINWRVDEATRKPRALLAHVEDRAEVMERELWRTVHNLPRTLGSFVLWLAPLSILNIRIWWLECRQSSLQGKLYNARLQAIWEWQEEARRREEEGYYYYCTEVTKGCR